ncbi:TPA: GNAT family N-acetyltransferase [Streptococcus suis]|nr:GNAT family N-acetyltransferase [Streptococcus suis]
MIKIIPFNPSYENEVIELILTIQQDEFGLPINLKDQPDLLDIDSHYPKSFWLAFSDRKLVGCVGLVRLNHQNVALKKMFVHPKYRQYGVGKQLVSQFFDYCRKHAVNEVYLGTTDTFQAAQFFYKKLGFCEITKDDLPADFPKLDVDNRFYRYQLHPSRN